MLKKKSFYIMTLIIGIVLFCSSFLLRGEELKTISGILIGIGAGLIGMSIVNLWMKGFEEKNPELVKENEIEFKDERKVQLRNRAGYISWAVTMVACFIASFIAALFRAGTLIVCILAGVAVAEYILATIIYRYLCKKM